MFEILFQGILGPRFLELSNGTELLDMTPLYTPDQAYKMIDQYGSAGRAFYNYIQLADLFFPIVYSLLLTSILFRFFSAVEIVKSQIYSMIYLPLLAGLCDWLENLGIFMMLRIYPQRLDWIASLTNLACLLKFSGIGLSIALILFLTSVGLVKRFRN